MEVIYRIFGTGKDLDILQMCVRAIVIFLIALVLIRISGRRSFGLRTPFDNIIAVLLGSILSRPIVGASPFIPTIVACFVIVLIHRWFGWLTVRYKKFAQLIEGNKILVFSKGGFIKKNLRKALASEEDIMEGVRKSALTDDMKKIERVYMERNGEVSALKKDEE